MNMKELKERLYEMTRQSKTGLNLSVHPHIINEILRQYSVRTDYYENDAINSMKQFLERGVLSFESSKETRQIYCALAH